MKKQFQILLITVLFPLVAYGQESITKVVNGWYFWEEIINSRILTTFLTLLIGKYFLEKISDARAQKEKIRQENKSREEKIREEIVKFLDEVSKILNQSISTTFNIIRIKNKGVKISNETQSKIRERISALFENRFPVKVKSKAYLESNEFAEKYDMLMWEITDVNEILRNSEKEDKSKLISKVREKKSKLSDIWEVQGEHFKTNEEFAEEYKELFDWTSMIYRRAVSLLTEKTEKI